MPIRCLSLLIFSKPDIEPVDGATEKKQLMPRYIKEVNPRLVSLFKDYMKKFSVKDMSKLTSAEKRAKTEPLIFFKGARNKHRRI
jgi:hypothetical protein